MTPRIGLIARCEEARGLAIQSKGFYDHMPVDKVLLVRMPPHNLDCVERPEWYPGATHISLDTRFHQLDERTVMEFFDGLDVVFSVETPYDWRLPDWARKAGVKTVIQGNPEFYRNDQPEFSHQAEPDAWWWPTPWRMERLPRGQYMPVPMPGSVRCSARPVEPLSFVHVVGKRAYGDRNGTDIVLNALRVIEEPCKFTIQGWGWELPQDIRTPFGSPVELHVEHEGVQDRWSMYDNHHCLVLPRRYGGLSLPALEAAACGLAVLMPDVSPNETLASLFVSGRTDGFVKLAAGRISTVDVPHMEMGRRINELCRDPEQVFAAQEASYKSCPRWSEMHSVYMDELERVCSQ